MVTRHLGVSPSVLPGLVAYRQPAFELNNSLFLVALCIRGILAVCNLLRVSLTATNIRINTERLIDTCSSHWDTTQHSISIEPSLAAAPDSQLLSEKAQVKQIHTVVKMHNSKQTQQQHPQQPTRQPPLLSSHCNTTVHIRVLFPRSLRCSAAPHSGQAKTR